MNPESTSAQIEDYIFMDEKSGTITFHFDKLWNLPMKPFVVEFFIIASTKAGVSASKRVSLIRRQEFVNITANETVNQTKITTNVTN